MMLHEPLDPQMHALLELRQQLIRLFVQTQMVIQQQQLVSAMWTNILVQHTRLDA